MKKNIFKCSAAILTACTALTACSGGDYASYASAYNKVTANGGMDADFQLTLEMDGVTKNSNGNFKLDTSSGKGVFYYELDVDGVKITQFSDGDYVYTDTDGKKTKYAINAKPSAPEDSKEADHKNESGVFDTDSFLSEFSSFLEAGKIRELGLLSPIDKNAVTKVSLSDNVYTLTFSDNLVKKYLNVIISNQTGSTGGDALRIDELKDLTYKATVSGDIITDVQCTGTLSVHVPGSLTDTGSDADYSMDMDIRISFVNPGTAVTVDLPSTDGFEEV